MAEVTTFPSPSPAALKPEAPQVAEAPKPQRVVITPDGLVAALQGKLQQAAEKAAQAAVAKELEEAVRNALNTIEEARQSGRREVEELSAKQMEVFRLSSNQEFPARLDTQLTELASRWKEQLEVYRGRTEEMAQRLEKQAAELRRELVSSQEFMERMTREIEPQIHARLGQAVAQATLEFEGATARAADRRYHAPTREVAHRRLLDGVRSLTHM